MEKRIDRSEVILRVLLNLELVVDGDSQSCRERSSKNEGEKGVCFREVREGEV
jgi:hypothetical protein